MVGQGLPFSLRKKWNRADSKEPDIGEQKARGNGGKRFFSRIQEEK